MWLSGGVPNKPTTPPSEARLKACHKQCRIQKFIDGGTIFDGNCTCWCPNNCRFNLESKITELDHTLMWSDLKKFYRELSEE